MMTVWFWIVMIVCCLNGSAVAAAAAVLQSLTVLRHVQLVFRHGDRTPVYVAPPEPYYQEERYWPDGFGQLTRRGRAKAFKLGELLRQYYREQYLGQQYSVRQVHVRSSAADRCVETAQLVMAGAYPANSTQTQWDVNGYPLPLARLWQPAAIQTFMPADQDSLLRVDKPCAEADRIKQRLLESRRNLRLLQRHRPLLEQVETIVGRQLDSIEAVSNVHENMAIGHQNGYYWHQWNHSVTREWTATTEQEVAQQLQLFELAKYRSMFDDDLIKQVRAGELLWTIGERFKSKRYVQQQDYGLIMYSTHDVKLAALLQTLDVWNQQLVPYLATLMFELHQSRENGSQYYVRVWYLNETARLLEADRLEPYRLDIPGCDHDQLDEQELMCPLEDFLAIIQRYQPPQDWNHACGIHSEVSAMISVNILLLVVNLSLMFFLLMSIMYVCSCIKIHRRGYQPLR